jgi:SOS response regulatory protein OraA/RecX
MQQTQHLKQRMSQRGISREMVELVLAHGVPEQDKYVLGRKEALRLLEDFQRSERLLKKILDKGGVVVVADGDALITTYNYKQ